MKGEKKKEARNVTELRLYKLILNPMTDRAEAGQIVAISGDYDKLVQWYHSQLASEPYRDGQWYKVFTKGSPLEWFNPAGTLELNNPGLFGHGIRDEWVAESVYYNVKRSGTVPVIE